MGDAATATADAMWVLGGGRLFLGAGDMVPGMEGTIEMPLAMFLVEHEQGLVLLDTGLSPDAADDADPIYGGMRPHFIVKVTREEIIDAQLAAIGRSVSDITHLVLSHGHFDHCGGLPMLHDVPNIVMHATEWEHVQTAPRGRPAPVRTDDFIGLDESRLRLFDGDHDLFGDGAITLLEMPGHTPGNTSILVRLPSRSFLLSEDTVHVRDGYASEAVSGIDHDPEGVRASIRRLKEVEASSGAELWITHDLDDWQRYGGAGRRHT
jgi:glyoxylase-like metal-dependent hydrolase (beta-lactamase superfamily II)